MKFMLLLKADQNTEAGILPSTETLEAMGRFNEEMANAGVLLGGEGLQPSSKGARVKVSTGGTSVIDGPFAETKELIAGFWMIRTNSRDEAIEWARRSPRPLEGDYEIEIRQVFEADDFGEAFTPELREQEEQLRARTAQP